MIPPIFQHHIKSQKLIEEIKKGEYPCRYTLCIIALNLIEENSINIPESDYGMVSKIEKHLIDWWAKNKYKYKYDKGIKNKSAFRF